MEQDGVPLSKHPAWLTALHRGLGHTSYGIELVENGALQGYLPLAFVKSWLFGRFLAGMPYLNYGGAVTRPGITAGPLLDRAVRLADELNVRYLELRETQVLEHPALTHRVSTKVHMRMKLPGDVDTCWKGFDAKVRNQVRKGQNQNLSATWGSLDLLSEFYDVFAHNMRDLGTPVYSPQLFQAILMTFPDRAEFCVVRQGPQAVAAALLLHGWGVTEVPSASSLRAFNSTNANMFMYWHLIQRAIERKQTTFDFGRSTKDSNLFRFKKQWGAEPHPAEWQYYLRKGDIKAMRPDNPKYGRAQRIWKKLPVPLTRWMGPGIVRGIP